MATACTQLAETRAELAAARTRIVELEAQLGRNSQNSSKPPSSDPPWLPKPKGRAKRRRKRGGQPGHQAHQATVPERVDVVRTHRAEQCMHCQAALSDSPLTDSYVPHYVYHLPPIRPVVTENRCYDLKCTACGLVTPAPLPPDVPKGQYDPSVQAMTALLRGELRQSVRQTSSVMTQLLHVPMSVGMVAKTQEQVSRALEAPFQEAHQYAKAQDRPHADETSWPQDKQKGWLWVAVTGLVTVFLLSARRNADTAKQLLGEAFKGILVTDRWASYGWIDTAWRQLCWSHLKRDFKSFLDYGPEAKRLGELLLCETKKMFRQWHRVRDGTLSRAQFQLNMKPVRRQIEALLEQGSALPCKKVRGMCRHMLGLRQALFTFIDHQGVEPTNNAAERALRFAVLWRKGCFGSDSQRGCRFVERFLTVRATLRSQKRDLYAYLQAACTAALHGSAAPSLLPDSAQLAPTLLMAA